MDRPLTEHPDRDRTDRELVCAALEGHGEALDALIRRHQGFIYEIAVRMLWDPHEAEDATQEILVKIMTGLASFRGKSAFRTWAYRIATNHVLSWKRSRTETLITGFDNFNWHIDVLGDTDLAETVSAEEERRLLVEETRIACLSGMLLCLDRPQRLTLVLGEVFEVSDVVGAEILSITREGFRQRLARARQQLYAFMGGKCGLANPANPCRCARKTRGAIRAGIVDPTSLKFVASYVANIERSARERSRALDQVGESYAHLLRDQGRKDPPDVLAKIQSILTDRRFRCALNLDNES